MHVKKAHKVILSIFLTTLFLSLQFVVGGRLTYADGLKTYNSNGKTFRTGYYRNKTNGAGGFKTILVFAEIPVGEVASISYPTANGSYPLAS